MISKFLISKFSGYIAIIGVIAILGLVWYIYSEGKSACVNGIKLEQKEAEEEHVEETSNETMAIDRQYEKIITKVVEVPVGCVSDADKRTNEWLRNNYKDYRE